MRGGREGFILVATLGVLALLASLAGGAALVTRGSVEGAWTEGEVLRRDALIRAGIELAAHQLLGLRLAPDRIAGEIRLDDGTVRIAARDESGLIDLNWSEPALLAAAAAALRLRGLAPADFAAAVVAWRGRNEPAPAGATAAARAAAGTARAAAGTAAPGAQAVKRDGFRAVEDLRWLPGLTDEDVAALAEIVTVHNPSGKVNVLAAPDPVILALPEATPQLVAAAAALRRMPAERAAGEVPRLFARQQAYVGAKPGGAFRVRVEARRGATTGAVSAILIRAPADEAPYFITEWRE
ncbi:putative general secretion pathway protein K [Methylobacterium sp. 4-46]|uniref:type II secretion system protein GspK n=1 Tax=unclassified Methylobacterium TaxID=2615210 RepID=UPI000152E532|nr:MULTISPECIES: type II secretion system protein GspK [Methylobacterium]ACA16493.1 putative general secretion pathway protein K [Methylobacterium sp. 4-46]WFT82203.1 type II secretion system protein GspK [Methylobacterium nodulans]